LHQTVTSVQAGMAVHDRVVVTGTFGIPAGKVTMAYFHDGTCTSTLASTTLTLDAAGAIDATTFTQHPNVPGAYAFRASYLGGGAYSAAAGACEPLTVVKATPTVTTTIHNASHAPVTSVAAGTDVHDLVSVTGPAGTPTGTITLRLFTNSTCTAPGSILQTFALSGGQAESVPFTSFVPGSFAFQATYGGNVSYLSVLGPCEPFTMVKATPTVTSAIRDSSGAIVSVVPTFESVHGTVTVSGAAGVPTGTVTFNDYFTTDCTGVGNVDDVALVGGSATSTLTESRNAPSVVSFRVTYHGDAVYNSSVGACHFVTWKAPSTASTVMVDGAGLPTTSFEAGVAVYASVTVAVPVNNPPLAAPTGSVSGGLAANGTCAKPTLIALAPQALSAGKVKFGPFNLAPGTYSVSATYDGAVRLVHRAEGARRPQHDGP